MEAQIAIPDLDDDTIYNLNNDSSFSTSSEQFSRPRPFRGAELNNHSRSGSAISYDSSNGSRNGGILMPTAGGSSGSGSRATNATSYNNANGSSSSSFPKKGSFASLKAAIKGQPVNSYQTQGFQSSNAPTQDAYLPHLRNPLYSTGNTSESKLVSPIDSNSLNHSRTESLVSSASRNRAGLIYANATQTNNYPRHIQQSSLHSDHSIAPSLSDYTGLSHSGASSMPPLPPFPGNYNDNNAPPARTAYARSLSSRAFQANSSVDDVPMTALIPGSSHDRTGSYQSSADPQSAPFNWQPDQMGGYSNTEGGPLLPPQPHFAEAWQHGRGSSGGGSILTSDDGGGRGSFDQMQRVHHTPTASGNHRWKQSSNRPPVPTRSFFQTSENFSNANLPSGVGLEEPATPSEYAVNVLCSRFVTLAGVRVRGAMGGVDESDPSLERTLGPKADPSLDALLDSLAHICRKNAKLVTDSLFKWRATLLEEKVDMGEVRGALAGSQAGLTVGVSHIVNVLTRRKALATAFLLARALSQIASEFTPSANGRIGGLGENDSNQLQIGAFELMKDCSRDTTSPSKMQAEAMEESSKLLGVLSQSNFVAMGDQFIAHLEHCQRTSVASKEGDPALETAILAMRHLKITPYPMELFEEGAEFLEVVAKRFVAAHGHRVKSAYAEALAQMLLPVAKSATAELHHPTWIKALDLIGPRAFAMISRPRYWSVAYPLYVAVLCVSPEDKFLQSSTSSTTQSSNQGWSWFACLEAGVSKLHSNHKDRAVRSVVFNAAVCLLWTYIFRCRESSSTTSKRLESFFRIWYPSNRTTITPSDVTNLNSHIILVHLVLYRHFEFGRNLVLDFMRHQALSGNTLSLQPEVLSKPRMTIAIRAILLTLDSYVKSESPPLPLDTNIERTDKDELGNELLESFTFGRPEIEKAQEQFNDLIGKIALLCDHQVGSVTIFDEHVSVHRGTSITNAMASQKSSGDEDRYFWKVHYDGRFVVAYLKDHQSTMDLLRACFDSWPRCLSSSIPFATVLSALFKAHLSADSLLADSASQCLRRISSQRRGGAKAVVSGFVRCIFRQDAFCWEKNSSQMSILSKVEQSIKLWIEFLNIWYAELKKSQASFVGGQKGWEIERTSAWPIIDEVEAIGLFLLCSAWRPLRRQAVGVLRVVAKLDDMFVNSSSRKKESRGPDGVKAEEEEPTRIIHLLDMPCSRFESNLETGKSDYSTEMTAWDRARTRKWKRSSQAKETLGGLAASERTNEHMTWLLVIPRFLRMCLEHFPTTVAVFRSFVATRVLWMDQTVSIAAGTTYRFNTTNSNNTLKGQSGNGISLASNLNGSLTPEQSLMAEHWKMYILALCTTTTSIEGNNRSIVGEGASSDRIIAAKDLFQKLIPFMASDHARFRDAVVSSLGNININLYKTLLETLQTVSSRLSDDFKKNRLGARRNTQQEKLRTAVANVIQLTSPHMTKIMSEQSVVFLILQWVKDTFNFLTDKEIRPDWEFHRLRRFFAGVVEEFFNSLHNNLDETASERYLTFETKLRMFRLFRDWHSYSQAAKEGPSKLANLLATVAEQYRDDRNREGILKNLRNEIQMLSFHASSAMAALCQGVITLEGSAVPAPMSGSHLDTDSLLEWLRHLFISPAPQNHAVASRALKALLIHNISHTDLITKTTDYAFAESEQTTASRSFFAVLSDVLIEKKTRNILPLQQILCLGLIKLGHPDAVIRKKSFALLSSIDSNKDNLHSSQAIEGGVSSPLPATYLRAQRDVSTSLADRFPEFKVAMLCEYTLRLPSIDLIRRATTLGLLPEWLHQIELVEKDYDSSSVILPRRATLVLDNLLSLTIKYGDEHNFEIQDMWASLAEGPQYNLNASIVVKFLIQQALYLRSSLFITHAKRALSCLSHTILAPLLFSELCSYIEPSSMIPVPLELESMSLPDPALDHLYLANIESLLPPPSRRQTFSPGQVAILFVGELTYEKSHLLFDKLPLLLHAIFMNVDSLSPFTQEQVMAMFEQLLRSLNAEHGSNKVNSQVDQFFARGPSIFWTHDDIDLDLDACHTPRTMHATIVETLSILQSIFPNLNEKWGNVALFWATSNPVRHMACRSFQAFRTLLPKINYTMLADMLGRLSNTISDSTRIDNQTFALEILYTLKTIVQSMDLESDRQSSLELLCPVFWMNIACLNTVNEAEFCQSIGLMHVLLDHIDLDSEDVIKLIRKKCPDGWEGEMGGLQNLVLRGLKSSISSNDSFQLLARLAKIGNDQLVDNHDFRLGYLFLAALPWFLQMTDEPNADNENLVINVAEDIAKLATKSKKVDMERVATSIAKKRFRTKDDLIRQAINCCTRAGFLPNHAKGATLLLLNLTFNSQEWLRKQTLQILKLFFQSVDTKREEFYALGSELLMPLLRLLNTNLSLPALEVMEENIVLMGSNTGGCNNNNNNNNTRSGPSAQQILRMSMQWGGPYSSSPARRPKQRLQSQSTNEINSLFGQPEESGWSIPNMQDCTTRTRINILSVFKSVELLLDTPPVGEVNFVDDYDADENVFETTMTASRNEVEEEVEDGSSAFDLGDIVNQLHDLSSFFVDDELDANDEKTSRSGHTMHSSGDASSNHEQIAKILSRRAMNTLTSLHSGGSSSNNGLGGGARSESSLSVGSSVFRNNGPTSDDGANNMSTTTNKRGGVWSRKSLFGSKKGQNMTAKTTPTADANEQMLRNDYFSTEPDV